MWKKEVYVEYLAQWSGKTTTIKSICNLIIPDKGDIKILERTIKMPQNIYQLFLKAIEIFIGDLHQRKIYVTLQEYEV